MSTFETDEPFENTDTEIDAETEAVRGRPEANDHHDKGLKGGKDTEKHML